MKPEQLKRLAEALHPNLEFFIESEIVYRPPIKHEYWMKIGNRYAGARFDPETNPDQREEVLLWLLGRGWILQTCGSLSGSVKYYRFTKDILGCFDSEQDKDYTTALMMACEKELGDA